MSERLRTPVVILSEPAAEAAAPIKLVLSVAEAADALGIGRTKFYELLGRGEITAIRIDGRRLVTVEELHAFVRRCEKAA